MSLLSLTASCRRSQDEGLPAFGSVKVYEIDPLLCPKCGGKMRIISFIEEHKVIDKIINHLKLTFKAERSPPPQAHPQLAMAAEDRVEYI